MRSGGSNGLSLLSKRELDVVHCLSEGLTNREIAERLGLSQHTIKNYLFRIFDKLGVSSRLELLYLTFSQPSARPGGTRAPDQASTGRQETDHGSENLAACQTAAEQGSPSAQLSLAEMYRQGRNIPQDPVAAYMWYLICERTMLGLKKKSPRLKLTSRNP